MFWIHEKTCENAENLKLFPFKNINKFIKGLIIVNRFVCIDVDIWPYNYKQTIGLFVAVKTTHPQ